MGCGLEGQRNAVCWDHFSKGTTKNRGCLGDLLGFILSSCVGILIILARSQICHYAFSETKPRLAA